MAINSRQALLDYCMRRLGAPVIEINMDEEQANERLDDALQVMREQHLAGNERTFYPHIVTSSALTITTGNAASFSVGAKIVGTTSGATASVVLYLCNGNNLSIKGIKGTFVAGESVTDGTNTAIIGTGNFLRLGDTENKYITLPDTILSVLKIVPVTNTSGNGATNPFDLMYQLRQGDLYNLSNVQLDYYYQVKQQLEMINFLLVGQKPMRFSQVSHRLTIDADWNLFVEPGNYIMIECYMMTDEVAFTDLFNNQWLKDYLCALLKMQWGQNLKLFANIQILGGVTLNGDLIYQDGVLERDRLLEELKQKWTTPASFFIG